MTNIHIISFTEWWKTVTPMEKDKATSKLSEKCNVALSTVQHWGLGYRRPKARSQQLIVQYFNSIGIETDVNTLFP